MELFAQITFPPRSDVLVVDLTVLAVEMNCKVSFISPLADIHLFPWKLQSHVSWCPSVKWLHRQGSLFVTTSSLRRAALIQSKDAIYRKLLYPLPVECLSLNDLKIIVNRRKKNNGYCKSPDRRHHDNCTVILTKALSRLQCADKKLIILLLFWHLQSFLYSHGNGW